MKWSIFDSSNSALLEAAKTKYSLSTHEINELKAQVEEAKSKITRMLEPKTTARNPRGILDTETIVRILLIAKTKLQKDRLQSKRIGFVMIDPHNSSQLVAAVAMRGNSGKISIRLSKISNQSGVSQRDLVILSAGESQRPKRLLSRKIAPNVASAVRNNFKKSEYIVEKIGKVTLNDGVSPRIGVQINESAVHQKTIHAQPLRRKFTF